MLCQPITMTPHTDNVVVPEIDSDFLESTFDDSPPQASFRSVTAFCQQGLTKGRDVKYAAVLVETDVMREDYSF
jgi:hypothetical protein